MRCQCVGPTIPDDYHVSLAMMLIKPALLSYRRNRFHHAFTKELYDAPNSWDCER